VVVAVVTVRMVQVTINEIIDMVAVRHGLVATIGAVLVPAFVTATVMLYVSSYIFQILTLVRTRAIWFGKRENAYEYF